ncbi:MAG: hypothetical protein KKF62_11150 [Bacteroidetes bacterium]|nr:hypothetical protein [Bacteroidota bacterium]MBU1113835.1 hypothetical protein [Bacteroidota bacterium]MBU1798207.1 hypothetical protein [Bacteroidota bacterium]
MKTLIIMSFLLSMSVFAQSTQKSQINSNFYGYWLNVDYYNALINGVTPREAYKYNEPYFNIIISEKENKVGFSDDLNEIGFYDFTISNSSIIFEDKLENSTNTVTLVNNEMFVLKNNKGITKDFIKYPEKYQKENMTFGSFLPHFLINDLYFKGDYITLDSLKHEVSFTLDGEIIGVDGYNKYYVLANYHYGPPDYNSLSLSNSNIKKSSQYFAWEKSNDTLTIFSTIDTLGLNYKKGDVFLKLKKK